MTFEGGLGNAQENVLLLVGEVNQHNKAKVCREPIGACLPVFTLPELCLAARSEREVVATAYQQEYKFRVQHPWGQFRGSKMGSFRVRDK